MTGARTSAERLAARRTTGNRLRKLLLEHERSIIEQVLFDNNYNVAASAQSLGMNRSHLYYKMKKFNVKPQRYCYGNAAWRSLTFRGLKT